MSNFTDFSTPIHCKTLEAAQAVILDKVGASPSGIADSGLIYVNSSNKLCANINNGGERQLPTYYEVGSFSCTFSGIWAAPQIVTCNYVRAGNIVSLIVPDVQATATTGAFISSTTPLPVQLVSASLTSTYTPICVLNNSTAAVGQAILTNAGIFNIYAAVPSANFAGSGVGGFYSFAMTYII